MQTSKIRHQFYLPGDLSRALEDLAAKPGASKTAILTDALRAWLDRKAAHELDERFGLRLDRQQRIAQRSEAMLSTLAETLDLFVAHQLTLTAHQPAFDEETARLGRQRYQQFVDQLARRIARNRGVPRLNLWTFSLPGLAERREDIEPNLDYELERFAQREGMRVSFNKEARERYLAFAETPAALWRGNFRDLAASVTRMATLCPTGRIDRGAVEFETARLKRLWSAETREDDRLAALLDPESLAAIDPFDRVQLAYVVATCQRSGNLSEAGRALFVVSRAQRRSTNDADRLRKYLAKFGLSWASIADRL